MIFVIIRYSWTEINNIELADVQKIFKENCKIEILEECKEYDTGIQEKSGTDKQYEENESRQKEETGFSPWKNRKEI